METLKLEIRWIILGEDGRYVTLGRHSDPSPEELAQAEASLAAQGMAGWLVVMKGSYYAKTEPALMMVRSLGNPDHTYAEAVQAFQAGRTGILSRLG